MDLIKRNITPTLNKRLNKFPILSLTGPRQSGKTTLLKTAFPDYKYINLERIDYRQIYLIYRSSLKFTNHETKHTNNN